MVAAAREGRIAAPPRVLQVVLSLNPGGTERLVVDLVTRLRDRIPMAVCCLDEKGTWGRELEASGIAVTELRRTPGFRPGLGRRIAALAERQGANILHCHHYSPFVYGCLARARHPGRRIVFTEHGRLSDARPSVKRRWANLLLSHVPDRVFAVSRNLRSHLLAEGFRDSQVDVIYNGIDPGAPVDSARRRSARDRIGADDDTLVIGTIARLDPVKDLATLLRAAALVFSRRPVLTIVVGDGPERSALEHVARELNIAGATRFVGHRDDAREWLAACDVYVNSSISEGVSLTILEGMAASLPIVATRVGGTPEVVTDECGRLVPARDPRALADAITELAEAPALRDQRGAAARNRVQECFSLDRMIHEYQVVFEKLVRV